MIGGERESAVAVRPPGAHHEAERVRRPRLPERQTVPIVVVVARAFSEPRSHGGRGRTVTSKPARRGTPIKPTSGTSGCALRTPMD